MFQTGLPASLDALKLRAQLAAAVAGQGWSIPAARSAGLAHMKTALAMYETKAFERLDGATGGLEAARLLCDGTSVALRALFDSMAMENPDAAQEVTLCALGGTGAGEMAPASDVDILFLKAKSAGKATDDFIQQFLYALWDLGIDVGGGACRNTEETLELAREDVSERTALLSLRTLAGQTARAGKLVRRFREEIVSADATAFVEAKLAERDARVKRAGRSRYTVEPNLKDGKGGLRDLQLMRWLAQFLYGVDAFERWVGQRLLSVDDVIKYVEAGDFLWTLRFHLHAITGSKDDRLVFDVQPELAKRLGFEDRGDESGVERLMRRYFKTAMHVGGLTRLVCAKLEADAWKSKPSGLARFLPGGENSIAEDLGDFIERDGRLDFSRPSQIADDPVNLLRFFHVASSRRYDLHPEAVARIGRTLHHIDDDFRSDPRAARAFFAVLLDSPAPMAVMRLMTEAGVLGRFIPEFGDVVGRTQFNMYHHYTVDEHTLQAIGLLREIEQGEHPVDHPLSTRIATKIKARRALHLAVLLHDTGKGSGDQCEEGGARARIACPRLGLDDAETELVAWLIENHLLMSDTAQRRDIGDPRTVLDFAQAVGTVERLRLLTLLTVVDIRAVGPGVWNGWKGQLIRDLYEATQSVLLDGGESLASGTDQIRERSDQMKAPVIQRMTRLDPAFASFWDGQLPPGYWLAFTQADRLRHANFVRHAWRRDPAVSVSVRVDRKRSATEVMVWSPDRERLFAALASGLARAGADIVGASITTSVSGHAFDVFYIQDVSGRPYGAGDPELRDELVVRLRAIALNPGLDERFGPGLIRSRDAAFKVVPQITVEMDASDQATVIETTGRDRPGLLAQLAGVIADHGLGLASAQIDGYGERAVDSFYVTHKGGKLTDPELINSVTDALIDVLDQGEAALAAKAARHGVARAQASELR